MTHLLDSGFHRDDKLKAMPRWQQLLIAATAGAAHTFSFAPHNLWWLQLFTFAALFLLTLNALRLKDAALIGFTFGLAHFLSGVSWLYISLHVYGLMVAPLAAFGVFALACYMAVYPMLAAMLTHWLTSPLASLRERVGASVIVRTNAATTAAATIIFSAAWLITDHARSWVFTGFPWLAAGYAHTDSPLTGYAPLLSVYGVGALAALCAGFMGIAGQNVLKRRIKPALLAFLSIAIVLLTGALLTQTFLHTPGAAPTLSVRLLQGNVPQAMKFDQATVLKAAQDYIALTNQQRADLIVLPETAIPMRPERFPQAFDALAQAAKMHKATVLTGVPLQRSGQWTNSVMGYGPEGTLLAQTYSKHHLVPFGEFIPPGFKWFVDAMQMPLGNFARGAVEQPPFNVPTASGKTVKVAVNICYEDVFGEELTDDARNADVLLNVSNLAWFGDSWAMPQHLQIARMRSIELGRPSIRATNTGVTAVIDANGNVLAQLPLNTQGALDFAVPLQRRDTLFAQWGNVPGVALLILAVSLIARLRATRHR
jgi:apolipoprotein N-acyltransferase